MILTTNVVGQVYNYNENVDSLRKTSIDLLRNHRYSEAHDVLSILLDRKAEVDPDLIPTLYNNQGIACYGTGDYLGGIANYKKALKLYETNHRDTLRAQALVNLGMAYKEIGAFGRASECLFKATHSFQKLQLKKEKASALASLGNLYRDSENYDRAEYFLRKSLEIRKKIGYSEGVAYSLHSLGQLRLKENKLKDAKKLFYEALNLKESLGLEVKKASTLSQLGVLYLKEKKCDSASFYMDQSIAIRKNSSTKNTLQLALNHLHFGQIYRECGDLEQSRFHLQTSAEILSEQRASKDLLLAFECLRNVYEQQQRYTEAYAIALKEMKLKGEVLSEDNQKKLARLSIEYDVKGYQHEIALKKIENEYLTQRNKMYAITAVSLVLLLLIIAFLYRQNLVRKRKIAFQNETLITKNLRIQTLHSEQKHRTNNFFSLIKGTLLNDPSMANDKMARKLLARIDAISEVQKHLILDPNDDQRTVSLYGYLKDLVDQSQLTYDISIVLYLPDQNADGNPTVVSYDYAARIGIVVNELLTNTQKHAQSTSRLRAQLRFTETGKLLQIRYRDFGDLSVVTSRCGNGIQLIEKILLPIHGTVSLEAPFQYRVSIPRDSHP